MSQWLVMMLFVEIAVRIVVFGLVVGWVSYRNPNVTVRPKAALPLVALVFALLNTGIYWLAKPLLTIATLGMLSFALPFVLNGLFLYMTTRLLKYARVRVEISSAMTLLWLAALLTAAHGLIYLGFRIAA